MIGQSNEPNYACILNNQKKKTDLYFIFFFIATPVSATFDNCAATFNISAAFDK